MSTHMHHLGTTYLFDCRRHLDEYLRRDKRQSEEKQSGERRQEHNGILIPVPKLRLDRTDQTYSTKRLDFDTLHRLPLQLELTFATPS